MIQFPKAQWASTVRTYHLQTDDTTANNNHLLRNLLQRESTSAGDDSLLVDVQAGKGSRLTSRGDDNVLTPVGLLAAAQQLDLDLVFVDEGAGTLDVGDTVLLQQELNTLGQAIDGGVLGLHHLLKVELDISDLDTALLGVMQDLVIEVGVVEERFRGDTADVQASTTQGTALLDTDGLQIKKLGAANDAGRLSRGRSRSRGIAP